MALGVFTAAAALRGADPGVLGGLLGPGGPLDRLSTAAAVPTAAGACTPPAPASTAASAGGASTEIASGEDGAWRRLSPLSPLVRLGEAVTGLVVLAIGTQVDHVGRWALGACAVLAVLALFGAIAGWRVTRWQLADTVVQVDSGVVHRRSLRMPLTQVQAVDLVQPVVARLLGLAEVRLRAGAVTGAAGRLAYLPLAEAQALRRELLALVRRSAAGQAQERVLATVGRRTLLASLLLDPGVVLLAAWGTAIALALELSSLGAALVVVGLGLGGAAEQVKRLWHRLNAGYDLVVAEVPDGLRTRSGFLTRATETIPRGRVQAARIVQPLLWRPFGWCMLQLELAGGAHQGQGSPEQRTTVRSVLPVGSRMEVQRLLCTVCDNAPAPAAGVPPRARWRGPRSWRRLAWTCTAGYVASRTGRVRRVETWVPLSKVQGLRLVQGPLQRRLHLASLHVDAAGRAVHAVLRDRDELEAADLLRRLADTGPAARRAGP